MSIEITSVVRSDGAILRNIAINGHMVCQHLAMEDRKNAAMAFIAAAHALLAGQTGEIPLPQPELSVLRSDEQLAKDAEEKSTLRH